MWAALGWGALAASSLVLGALLALARRWRAGVVGGVLAFGAGALISSVAFELAQEGLQLGGPAPVAIGLAVGAASFYLADRAVENLGGRNGGQSAGLPLALGSLLDGVPEQAVLGIGLAAGDGVSIALLVAIFVSNLPEGIGSAADMREAGTSTGAVLRLWVAVAVICTLASVGGFALADLAGDAVRAGINGFAAGALLVMLIDSMVPEATEKAGNKAGLATVLGFAVAAALSNLA
jgi:ZIP family zinc transporter